MTTINHLGKGLRVCRELTEILESVSRSIIIKALVNEGLSHYQAIELVWNMLGLGLLAVDPYLQGTTLVLTHDGHMASDGRTMVS